MAEESCNPFTRMGVDKRSNRNRGFNILLMYDRQSSTPHSPAVQGAGLGPGIGDQVVRLYRTHA